MSNFCYGLALVFAVIALGFALAGKHKLWIIFQVLWAVTLIVAVYVN